MSGLTVACVLNSRQGRRGRAYTPEWVYALKRGVSRHLPLPYRSPLQELEPGTWTMRCLSDVDLGPMTVPLIHGWPGWWSKVELFRPGLFEGRVLYLDLDTLPVGDLSGLAAYDGPFAMLSDFYQPKRPASGVMAWEGDECAHVYEAFCDAPRFGGRMDHWLERHAAPERLQDHFPGQLVSLKAHCKPPKAKGPPEGARLVCFHGRPRPDDPKAGWAYKAWTDLAREEVVSR